MTEDLLDLENRLWARQSANRDKFLTTMENRARDMSRRDNIRATARAFSYAGRILQAETSLSFIPAGVNEAYESFLTAFINGHALNKKMGWWSHIDSGLPIERNRGELFMLITSEILEAMSGRGRGTPDEHLSHWPNWIVEYADCAIRVCDVLGAWDAKEEAALEITKLLVNQEARAGDCSAGFFVQIEAALLHVGAAFEASRKGNEKEVGRELARLLYILLWNHTNLGEVVEDKMTYNLTRADHKIENRRAIGGKKF